MQQAADAVSVASLRPSQLQVQAAGGAGWTQIPRRWNTSTRRSCGRRRCAGRGRAVSSRVAGGAGRGHDGARCDKWRRTSKSGGVAGGRRYDISGGSCGVAGAIQSVELKRLRCWAYQGRFCFSPPFVPEAHCHSNACGSICFRLQS